MKIKFDNYEANNITNSQAAISALDIVGSGKSDAAAQNPILLQLQSSENEEAYGLKGLRKSNKKTLAEEIENAGNYDAETASRFMAVMSNTMSQKDFNKMMEEGYNPSAMDAGEAITNLDRIKVILAESGTVIAGFNDDIDASTAEKITGSAGRANEIANASLSENASNMMPQISEEELTNEIEQAFEKADLPVNDENMKAVKEALNTAKNITNLSDNSLLYMVNNELEPTIENVYEAQYASGSGQYRAAKGYFSADGSSYMVSKAEDINFDQIVGQVDEIIEKAGLEVNDEIRDDARWLLENGVALTDKSINLFEDLKSMEIPPDDYLVLSEITNAMAEGKDATEAYLISGYRKIKNARILEEVRLAMTHKANASLAESDYSIDTSELTDKVDTLKEKENNYYKLLFGGNSATADSVENDISTLKETLKKVDEIKAMPVEILASFSSAEEFTLQEIHDAGVGVKQRYDDAMKTYEAVGTEVRTDLGDSIDAAFDSVDGILKDMGYEVTYDNQRAARILGYNGIAITSTNLENVRYVDSQVRSLIERMTPATTVKLIQMRIDPMEIDVGTLSTIVDTFAEEDNENADGYAKFLVKLEQSNEISDEEAASYIGIYRLFDKIEKSDGAIIGSLISSGKDLTLKNLLTESRNHKKYGKIDELIDDEHPMTEAQENSENLKIDTQIETAFQDDYLRHSTKEILRKLDPSALKEAEIDGNSTVGEILSGLEEYSEESEAALKEEYENTAEELRAAAKADIEIFNILRQLDVRVSAENVNAATEIFRNRGSFLSKLYDKSEKKERKQLEREAERLADSFDNEEKAKAAYLRFTNKASNILHDIEMRQNKSIDLKTLQLVGREFSVARSLADHEDYEVPLYVDGSLTAINLRIVHGNGEGRVDVRIETENLGNVSASFTIKNNSVDGTIISDKMTGSLAWRNGAGEFTDMLKSRGLELKSLNIVTEMNVKNSRIIRENDLPLPKNGERTDSTDLYRMAKSFIAFSRRIIC